MGGPPGTPATLLLDELIGADVRFTGELDRASVDSTMDKLGDALTAEDGGPMSCRVVVQQPWERSAICAQVWSWATNCWPRSRPVAALAGHGLVRHPGRTGRWGSLAAKPDEVVGVTVSRPVAECVARSPRSPMVSGACWACRSQGRSSHQSWCAGVGGVTVLGGYMGAAYGQPSAEGAGRGAAGGAHRRGVPRPVVRCQGHGCASDASEGPSSLARWCSWSVAVRRRSSPDPRIPHDDRRRRT